MRVYNMNSNERQVWWVGVKGIGLSFTGKISIFWSNKRQVCITWTTSLLVYSAVYKKKGGIIQYAHRLFHEPNFLSNRTEPNLIEPNSNRTQPDRTQPNPTRPNGTEPSPTQPNSKKKIFISSCWVSFEFKFGSIRLGSVRQKVRFVKKSMRVLYWKEKKKKAIYTIIDDVAAGEDGRVGTTECGGEWRTHNTRHTVQSQTSELCEMH